MDTSIFIVIGIALVIFLFFVLRKNPERPNNTKAKKEQFNPEKASSMAPERGKNEVEK